MITRFDRFNLAAVILVTALAVVLFLVWWRFPYFKSFGQGDPYLDANQYVPGRNFAERGFFREHLLAQYATGPEEAYPLWYTHNPPLSEILSGIYYRLGLRDISGQRVIAILWNLLGAWFFYLLAQQLAGPRTALISLAVFISNPVYIYWGDSLFTNHQWAFIFMAMYFFLRAGGEGAAVRKDPPDGLLRSSVARNGGNTMGAPRPKTCTLLAAGSFFLLSYSNYEYVPFVFLFFIGVKLLKLRKVHWSRLGLLLGAGLAAVALHQACVIRAVGVDLWVLDKAESLLHRTGFGVTPLMEVYRKAPLLMWEEYARLHSSLSFSFFWKNFYLHLENLFGWGWGPALAAALVFGRFLLPADGPGKKAVRRGLLLLFAAAAFWFVVFVQHTADHQWGSTVLLLGPFAAVLYGTVLSGIWENLLLRKWMPARITGAVLIAAIVAGLFYARVVRRRPLEGYPGMETLRKCRGVRFVTSAIPTVVSACTGVPAGWMAGRHPGLMISHARYLVNPGYEITSEPAFFFSPRHPEHPRFASSYDDWLSKYFEIIEQGENYTIYNLSRPLREGEPTYIDRYKIEKYIHRLPRARPVRVPAPWRRRYQRPTTLETEEKIAAVLVRFLGRLTGVPLDRTAEAEPPLVRPVTENLLLPPSEVNASSQLEDRPPASLFVPGPDKFWHVDEEKLGQPAWLAIDLGPGREAAANLIRTLPRDEIPTQSFRTAVIHGSSDGKTWVEIAAVIDNRVPVSRQWRQWFFTNETPYRYYLLLIVDGHERDGAFYSLGGLELYRAEEVGE